MFKGLFPKTSFQKDIVKYDFISVFIFSKKKTDNETKKTESENIPNVTLVLTNSTIVGVCFLNT